MMRRFIFRDMQQLHKVLRILRDNFPTEYPV
jgi:hypothetical protein